MAAGNVILFLFLSVLFVTSLASPPFNGGERRAESEGKQGEEKEKPPRPLHDSIMERMKKIQDSLINKGQGDEYKRYWEELVANNPELARRFKDRLPEDLAAKIGDRFALHNGDVRSQLDELQRRNLEEMRDLHRQKVMNPTDGLRKMRESTMNPEDLEKRIKEHHRIQEQLDHARRDEFKNYEMKLEHLRRQKMKQMDETQRLREEARLKKLGDERKNHEQLLHPASKQQLEEVWKMDDGLKDETFNARTFFHLHDTNNDNMLDIHEVEALFVREIKKYYGENYQKNREAHEEMSRMREHVMSEVDRDRDSLITLDEFLRYASTEIFNVNEEWKPIAEEQTLEFTDDEFKQYEDEYEDEDYDYDENGNPIKREHKTDKEHGLPPEGEHGLPPQGEHGLPQEEHGLPPQGEHGLPPHAVPQGEHGLPPQGEHGLPPHAVPQGEHGLPPQGEHGLPPQGEHGLPHQGEHDEKPTDTGATQDKHDSPPQGGHQVDSVTNKHHEGQGTDQVPVANNNPAGLAVEKNQETDSQRQQEHHGTEGRL